MLKVIFILRQKMQLIDWTTVAAHFFLILFLHLFNEYDFSQ